MIDNPRTYTRTDARNDLRVVGVIAPHSDSAGRGSLARSLAQAMRVSDPSADGLQGFDCTARRPGGGDERKGRVRVRVHRPGLREVQSCYVRTVACYARERGWGEVSLHCCYCSCKHRQGRQERREEQDDKPRTERSHARIRIHRANIEGPPLPLARRSSLRSLATRRSSLRSLTRFGLKVYRTCE